MSEPVLEVQQLRKVFQLRGRGAVSAEELVAVDDVSFEVCPGESLAIVGESGSGKTTTVRMILGLEAATSGRILVDGAERSTGRLRAAARRSRARETQIVFQDPYVSLDPRQTVGSCLEEVLKLHFSHDGPERARVVHELLEQVGLPARTADVLPRALSGGQRQRVAIARALAAQPRVLILDEAVSALDVSVQAQVLNLLADLREQTDVAYLFISHDLSVVRQVSDRIVVMRQGQIVEAGETGSVLDGPQHEYTQRLLAAVPRLASAVHPPAAVAADAVSAARARTASP